ncbi:hypothetical protein DNU06_14010 [Putridiphycobacter roseus]|uniref:PKD domain-containing protein n=1 Tax=Putridiphycobacter roseus TaxID=2219161 RepID=A0A2W1MVW1_9FLAO|nr:gliding motility-associated C-terminal domain-containing protein [Putridiphycobacter roseus]PZE16239.1 hypothetical protein DNU06_14010 [Putridiphycobacter roseus]
MNNLKRLNFYLIFILISVGATSHAQNVAAYADNTFLSCGGGVVKLSAVGNTSSTIFGDNFNTSSLTAGWTTGPAAQFNNPCGTSLDGTTYLWMGSSTSAPRTLTTSNLDVSCGGNVCFDFKFMCEYCGDQSPCEGADFYNEGVSLQYSTNGTTWIDIAYFAPNGNLLTNYPGIGATAPIAFGATNFTTWDNYCFPIPIGAVGNNTKFRLFQWGSSGNNYDHWGIDNFYVNATPCSPYYYDWLHIPGSPDAASVSTYITQTTTFVVNYTDGVTTFTDQVTVVVDNLEFDTIIVNPASCYGLSDASIQANMLNGQAPYSFILNGPIQATNSTGNFNNLQAGLYVLEVTDALGCTVIANVVLPEGPSCCTVTSNGTDPTCDGYTDGAIVANASGGIPSYAYQWYTAANTPINGQTYQSIGGLSAGTYYVEIQDISGCINRDTITISAPLPLTGNLITNQISCFGSCNGAIQLQNPAGGTPPYQYSLNGNNFSGINTFPNLCEGNYTFTIKDNKNCTLQLLDTIIEPEKLVLFDTLIKKEICGGGDGEIYVSAEGGSPIYTYTLGANTNTNGIFTNLSAGSQQITVTDINGCTTNIDVTLLNIPPPNPVIDYQQDVACAGGINGAVTIVVTITTGTSPFTFNLNNTGPSPTNTFNVNAGAHSVVVNDANNCTGTIMFNIGQPSPLSFTTSHTDINCNGVCDGTVTVNASGATPPYQYSSDGGLSFQNSPTLTGLCAGNTDVRVIDANGCLANSTINIGGQTAISSSYTKVDPTCHNGCDGSISFGLTSGGNPNYLYSVDDGTNYFSSPFFVNQCAGTYNLKVKDANNCVYAMNGIVLNNPLEIGFNTISNTGSNCNFSNGGFEVQAINGTAGYIYSIDNFTNTQNNGNFSGLNAGIYTVIVQDASGCEDTILKSVSDLEISTTLDSTHNVTCFGGQDGAVFVEVTIALPPISFTLDSIYFQTNGAFDAATNPNVHIPAGTHYVIIHDSGNCSDFYEFTITEPDSITYNINTVNTTCLNSNDGQISFSNILGGNAGPYSYSIDSGLTYHNTNTFIGLAAGIYNTRVQDSKGCYADMQITISEPSAITTTINPTNLICHGDQTGSMIFVAQGDNGPYNFDIGASSNTTGIFIGLNAGLYNIKITDANGCTLDTVHTLNQPDTITAVWNTTDNACFGNCDGEILVTALGGTLPYLYSANNGVNQQASNLLTNLCNGIHNIQIEDFKHCVYNVNQTITSPTQLIMSTTKTAATCGVNNGSITATLSGGTLPYNYYISNDNGLTFSGPSTNNQYNNLSPGSYLIKVVDNNFCSIQKNIVVSATNPPTIDFVNTVDILCFGNANGSITINSAMGTGMHEYSMDGINYQTSNTFTGIAAGTYSAYVRDANLCVSQSTATINEPAILNSTISKSDLICNNDFSGSINVVPNGGKQPYTYSIDNGISYQSAGTYTYLDANNYTVIVIDANNCSDTNLITITEPLAITTPNFTSSNTSCYGFCDGSIDLGPSGGTGTLTYQWTGNIANPNSAIANNVCAGTYNAIITDANGCSLDVFNIILTEPPAILISSVVPTNIDCYKNCTGEILVNAPNAVNYEIIQAGNSTISPSNTFSNLCIGNYDIIVTDVFGCTDSSNTTITQPDSLYGTVPNDWENVCFGSSLNISAGFTYGGTGPFTFNWVDNYANTYPATNVFTQVATQNNTFTFDITDANGCTAGPYSFNMTVTDPLTSSITSNVVHICPGGTALITAKGINGQLIDFGDTLDYAYSWNTGNPNDTLSTLTVSPNDTTTYTVSITDYCNTTDISSVTINVYPDPTPKIVGGDTICAGEPISLSNGNYLTGSSCNWKFSNGYQSNSCSPTINFTEPGCYDVTLSVSNPNVGGPTCYATVTQADIICINPLPIAKFTFAPEKPIVTDGKIDFMNQSIGADYYNWRFGGYETTQDSSPLFQFSFDQQTIVNTCLEVATKFGCKDVFCKTILIQDNMLFYVPNSFTPDYESRDNNIFKAEFTAGFDPYEFEMLIFNRWGEIVFQSRDVAEGWDGNYGTTPAIQAVYVWKINYLDTFDGTHKTATGHVTLLR